jgi:2-methylcitrate dehydratase PrpD
MMVRLRQRRRSVPTTDMNNPGDHMADHQHPSQLLASFAANLHYEQIPDAVRMRTEDLFLDWIGSALAGRTSRAVQTIDRYAQTMGPGGGPCDVLISRRTTTPLFAAMVNAAASHVAEQDDVHNGSVFHPGAVVFPAAVPVVWKMR